MSATRAAFYRSGRRVRTAFAPSTTFYWWRNFLELRTLGPATPASATGQSTKSLRDRPRNRNWRKPITDLMMPNTGSGVCLRRA
jgi:hypothetical protein